MPLLTNSFFLVSPSPSASPESQEISLLHSPVHLLGLVASAAGYAQHQARRPVRQMGLGCGQLQRTRAQAQNLDMVARVWSCQGQNRRRKEHGFVIGMRNEQADALVQDLGEAGLDEPRDIDVDARQQCKERRQSIQEGAHAEVLRL